ncbi:MAG: chromosomal replication initiator protein DnaA [Campylobacterota bacterium]|nr:chromosomal replication initiator protein DnaA [Campylobacterota bacterium]
MTTQSILKKLKGKTSKNEFDRYFKQLIYIEDISNNKVAIFEVPNSFIARFIKTKYSSLIADIIESITKVKPTIEITTKNDKKEKQKVLNEIKKDEILISNNSTPLNENFTFDLFVVGSSNEMAYTASKAVAKKPGIQYNPLFIYGDTGLGKTHLLQAIGNDAIKKNKTVIYVTVEQFMNDFLLSIKKNNMEYFKNKYRNCDLLLIDDIQFLTNKESTQEEFFHTFNELHSTNKQIVMTSDKMPSEICGIEERLKSRFEHGLKAHVVTPQLETKIAIIEKKSELNGIYFTKEIVNYIAINFDNSVREIEGVLIQINASATLLGKDITIDLVKNLFKVQVKESSGNVSLSHIIEMVSIELNIKPSDLKSSKRTANVVKGRRVVIYLARELTHNSMPDIAKLLKMKDHSSVSKNIAKANELKEKDENFKLIIENLKNKIINT